MEGDQFRELLKDKDFVAFLHRLRPPFWRSGFFWIGWVGGIIICAIIFRVMGWP